MYTARHVLTGFMVTGKSLAAVAVSINVGYRNVAKTYHGQGISCSGWQVIKTGGVWPDLIITRKVIVACGQWYATNRLLGISGLKADSLSELALAMLPYDNMCPATFTNLASQDIVSKRGWQIECRFGKYISRSSKFTPIVLDKPGYPYIEPNKEHIAEVVRKYKIS